MIDNSIINNKEKVLDFKKFNKDNKNDVLSDDIIVLDDVVADDSKKTKLNGKWQIVSIIDVSKEPPKIDEANVISADFGNKDIKRGDYIYITCQLKRPGQMPYNNMNMGVLKCRITDIFNSMAVLNNLPRD